MSEGRSHITSSSALDESMALLFMSSEQFAEWTAKASACVQSLTTRSYSLHNYSHSTRSQDSAPSVYPATAIYTVPHESPAATSYLRSCNRSGILLFIVYIFLMERQCTVRRSPRARQSDLLQRARSQI